LSKKDGCSILLREANDALNHIFEKTVHNAQILENNMKAALLEIKVSMIKKLQDASVKSQKNTHKRAKPEPSFLLNKFVKVERIGNVENITKEEKMYPEERNEKARASKAEMRYPCPYCVFASKRKDHLNGHVNRKHLKNKTFQCDVCNFTAYQKWEVKNHLKKKHQKSTNTNEYLPMKEEQPAQVIDENCTSTLGIYSNNLEAIDVGQIRNCTFCTFVATETTILESHIESEHGINTNQDEFSCNMNDHQDNRIEIQSISVLPNCSFRETPEIQVEES
jgi:hypothetical protein